MLKNGLIFKLLMAINVAKDSIYIFAILHGINVSFIRIDNECEIQCNWFYLHLSFDMKFYGYEKHSMKFKIRM